MTVHGLPSHGSEMVSVHVVVVLHSPSMNILAAEIIEVSPNGFIRSGGSLSRQICRLLTSLHLCCFEWSGLPVSHSLSVFSFKPYPKQPWLMKTWCVELEMVKMSAWVMRKVEDEPTLSGPHTILNTVWSWGLTFGGSLLLSVLGTFLTENPFQRFSSVENDLSLTGVHKQRMLECKWVSLRSRDM